MSESGSSSEPPSQPATSTGADEGAASSTGGSEMGATGGNTNGGSYDDFLQTGRTGRRNAVPDIVDDKSKDVSTADLPAALGSLSCSDEQGCSSSGAGTSQGTSSQT